MGKFETMDTQRMRVKSVSIYPGTEREGTLRAFVGFYPAAVVKDGKRRGKVEIRKALVNFAKNDGDAEFTQSDTNIFSVPITEIFSALKTKKVLLVHFKDDEECEHELAVIGKMTVTIHESANMSE